MNYIISIEGQSIPVPEEIGATDEAVKRTLAPIYPEAANAMITRTEKDGTTTITVVKRAGSKGTDLTPNPSPIGGGGRAPSALEILAACDGGMNPAVAMFAAIRDSQAEASVEALLALDARLAEAVKAGRADYELMSKSFRRLKAARALPAPDVVLGF